MNLTYSNKDSYQLPITQSGRCSYRLITTNNPSVKISDNYIDVSNENEPYPEANSISAWIKINGTITDFQNIFVNLFGRFGSDRCNVVQFYSNTELRLIIDGTIYRYYDLSDILEDQSKWHYYKFNRDTLEISIDGKVNKYRAIGAFTGDYQRASIGKGYYNNSWVNPANISICDIKIFDNSDNLIHWYPCSEGNANIIYDTVGTQNINIVGNYQNDPQSIFDYNNYYGYGTIANSTAKVPLTASGITFLQQYNRIENGFLTDESNISGNINQEYCSDINNLVYYFTSVDNYGIKNILGYKNIQSGTNLLRINSKLSHND